MNGFQSKIILTLLLFACRGPDAAQQAKSTDARQQTVREDADFRAGASYLHKHDWARARDAFDRARKTSPNMADWSTYYAAYAAANLGDTLGTQQRVAKLTPQFRHEWAWRAPVLAFEKARAFARGAALADSIAGTLNGPVRRADALVRSAQLYLALHDTTRALEAARTALVAGASSPTGLAAGRVIAAFSKSTKDLLSAARAYMAAGENSAAITLLTRVRKTSKASADQRRAIYLIGSAQYARRQYDAAVRTLAPLAARADSLGAEAVLLTARAQLRAQHTAAARTTAIRLTHMHTRASAIAAAHFLIADLADDAGDWKTARTHYSAIIATTPLNDYGASSFMRLGTHALATGDTAGAIAVFTKYANAHMHSDHAQQAFFWLGQAFARAKRTTDARKWFTKARDDDAISYYGLLSGDWLREQPSVGGAGPSSSQTMVDSATRSATRVHLLETNSLRDAAVFELYRATQNYARSAPQTYAFAEALIGQNEAAAAIRLGLQRYRSEHAWNRRLLNIVFPMPFEATIKKEATSAHVDPFLVAALIRQESTFDPDAVSGAGAVGLMQVMPATARAIGKSTSLRDPATNIHLGVAHLKGLIANYHGVAAYLLAAYNAGQTPVSRWLELPGAADPLLFAERIPYAETRYYVQIVQRNAHMYRLLYSASN